MTKEVLKEKIKETIELNKKFESFSNSMFPSNDIIKEWLYAVLKDIENDLIPEKLRDVINHQIDDLNLNSLSSTDYNLEDTEQQKEYEDKRIELASKYQKYLQTFQLFNSVGYAKKNTVIIGANGSGKTTLANKLKETLNIDDGIVIPAQKLLIVPTFVNLPSYEVENKSFSKYQKNVLDDKRTFNLQKNDDIPYNIARDYTSEYRNILALLISERNYKRSLYLDNKQDNSPYLKSELKTTFDSVVEIWNELIPHRKISLTPESIPHIKYKKDGKEEEYDAFMMSDGERIILYLVARVMQAPANGLIIVDEPEVFLHRTVVDKLWNRLEKERNDCTFIYMTHDLQFATSRVGLKSWIKGFHYPSTWDIQLIDNSEIPEQLLMELLGSCKQILFCEGNSKTSLDKKIFDILFPEFIIYPLKSCKDVISYTKAYNAIPNTNTKAIGIIDKDFRSKDEIADLESNHIYTYQVAEIENIFLVESFIKALKEHYHLLGDIEKIKSGIMAKFANEEEMQISNYVSSRIDYHYHKYHVHKGNTKDEVEAKLKDFNNDIDIEKWYKERKRELDLYIKNNGYDKVIGVYNNKGLYSVVEKELKITDYHSWALNFLKVAPQEIRDDLRGLFPIETSPHNTEITIPTVFLT